VNTDRLVNYIRLSLVTGVKRVALFPPNDDTLWRALGRLIKPFMRQIGRKRGLSRRGGDEGFVWKCDETTNSADVVQQKKLVGELYIRPQDAAEFIEIPLVVVGEDVTFKEAA